MVGSGDYPGGGLLIQLSFKWGVFALRCNLLHFHIPFFFSERYAFHVPFIDKTIRLLVMTSEIFELKTIFNFLRKYHQTSLLWKPTGQREVSAECLPITDVFTMIRVGPTRGVFVLRRCPEYK